MHCITRTSFALAVFCAFSWYEAFNMLHLQILQPGSVLSVAATYSLGFSLCLIFRPGPKLLLSFIAVGSLVVFAMTISSSTFMLSVFVALTIITVAFIYHDYWHARLSRNFDDTISNVGIRIFLGGE